VGRPSETHTKYSIDIPNWGPNHPFDPSIAAAFPRSQTIEFALPPDASPRKRHNLPPAHIGRASDPCGEVREDESLQEKCTPPDQNSNGSRDVPRTSTPHTGRFSMARTATGHGVTLSSVEGDVGFGGFPMPHQILGRLISAISPVFSRHVPNAVSISARTVTVGSQAGAGTGTVRTGLGINAPTRSVPYISFDAVVGRNSYFHDLSKEEVEELGGVEYRTLRMLLWLVPAVSVSILLMFPQ
jgi:Trk/Ktr/HKT type cation transporter